MILYLHRFRSRKKTTDGELFDENNQKICDTAEHTPSMLMPGTYKLELKRHKKLGYKVPYIVGYSAFIGKQNGVFLYPETINVGENIVPGVVLKTHRYFDLLYMRILKAQNRRNKVLLIIEY